MTDVYRDPDRVDRVDPEYSTPFGGNAVGLAAHPAPSHRALVAPPDVRKFGWAHHVDDPRRWDVRYTGRIIEQAMRSLAAEAARQGYVLDLTTFRDASTDDALRFVCEGTPR